MFTVYKQSNDDERRKLHAIYEQYKGTMLKIAKSILPDNAMAEDAVSAAFIKIIKNLHKIDCDSSFKTKAYVSTIVKSCALDMHKKLKTHPEAPIDEFEFADNNSTMIEKLVVKESVDELVNSIRALPKSLSDVLYLSVVLEHTTEEISDALNISKDVVRQRLSRAKKKLRNILTRG